MYESKFHELPVNLRYSLGNLQEGSACSPVYLYGAGTGASGYSKIVLKAVEHLKIKVKGFIDDDTARHGGNFLGYTIYPADILKESKRNTVILSSNYIQSILQTLLKYSEGLEVYGAAAFLESVPDEIYDGVMDPNEVRRRIHMHRTKLNRVLNSDLKKNLVLNVVDIQVTERCTMKCKDCSNLMQFYENAKDTDTEILIKSLTKLIAAVDKIDDVRLIGGEPFLYKDIARIINLVTNTEKISRVTVYTNATFVPKPDVLDALKHEKVEVEITNYGILSRNHDKLIGALDRHGIRSISHKPQNWTEFSKISEYTRSDEELITIFDRCCVNDVLTLLHGKLYHCPFSANVHNLSASYWDPSDWVELFSSDSECSLRESIAGFYFNKPFQTACRFCAGRDFTQKAVEPAVQTKAALSFVKFER